MADSGDVLAMLIPQGGYILVGDDYDGIQFLECEPITKAEFEEGFTKYDSWKAEQDATKTAAKTALLARLGITEEEAQLLIGGSN
jgi:hypothetical protein